MQRPARRGRTVDAAGTGSAPALGGVLEFMRVIWGVSHGLQLTSKRMNAVLGVTGPQRLVVRILGRRPGASAGQLAESLRLHPSTLTGILRRLEERGLIVRRRVEHDRRQARFRLTAAGVAIDRRHKGTVEAAIRRGLTGIRPGSLDTTVRVLRAIETALGASGRGRID